MTAEHFRVLLHNENDSNLLHEMAVDGEGRNTRASCRGHEVGADDSPPKARRGGVRGIVVGRSGVSVWLMQSRLSRRLSPAQQCWRL